VIDLLERLGLVKRVKGYPYRGPTTVQPTPKLKRFLPLGEADWSVLRLEENFEPVVLKSRDSDSESDLDVAEIRGERSPREEWTSRIIADMQAINSAILSAAIECTGSATVHISERPGAAMASIVTLHHRTLRRIFNGTWDQGGRLFGGFWQTMPRADRYRAVTIGGERTALVDYGQLFLRIAYAEAGVEPPPGDLYDVIGRDALGRDWKRIREARKKLVNALFFRKTPLGQWPGATLGEISKMRNAFPLGTKPREAISAIKRKHAPIADWFEHGHGLRMMRKESDLIVAVTLTLFRQGAVALPIHDAVLVRESDSAAAKAVMEDEARSMTGANIPADITTAAP
jgi:hypothetical protein